MLFRTHFIFAILVYILFFKYLEISLFAKIIFGVFLFLATVFVDIDAKNSKIGNHCYLRPLQWFISHRGMVHSLLFAFVISLVIFFFYESAGIGFFVGYLLHLLIDCLTPSGVSLFWPLSSFKIKGFIKSGGILEQIIFVIVLFLNIFLVVKYLF